MATYSIVFSPTGGTQKVTRILANALAQNVNIIDILQKNERSFTADDLCIISMPSFGGRIPSVCVDRMKDLKGNGARAVLVAVFGNRAIDDTLIELKDAAIASGFKPIAAIEAVAEHSIARQIAAGRPDAQDVEELKSFAEQIKNITAIPADLTVPGNRPYKAFGGVPMKPVGNSECVACGMCAEECPVGAIPVQNPMSVDESICISCMHCIAVCPQEARELDASMLAATAEKLRTVAGDRKSNKLYL